MKTRSKSKSGKGDVIIDLSQKRSRSKEKKGKKEEGKKEEIRKEIIKEDKKEKIFELNEDKEEDKKDKKEEDKKEVEIKNNLIVSNTSSLQKDFCMNCQFKGMLCCLCVGKKRMDMCTSCKAFQYRNTLFFQFSLSFL